MATLTFSWPPATKRTDGTPIPAGELVGYQIGVGTTSGTYTILTDINPNTTSEPESSLSSVPTMPGTYFAAYKAIGKGSSADSVWSNEVTFTISATPIEVGNFTVG